VRLELHYAPVLRLTGEQAQAGASAAADAVMVCPPPLASCLSFLTWLKSTVTAHRVTRSQAALKHPAVVPTPPSPTVCNRLSASSPRLCDSDTYMCVCHMSHL
jgi:hypothetical protein